jgi:hypothetical protein
VSTSQRGEKMKKILLAIKNGRSIPMNRRYLFPMIFVGFLMAGCAHSLEITNLGDYFSPLSSPLKQAIKLGITSNSDAHMQNSRYVTAITDGLQRTGSFERIIHPFNAAVHEDQVDTVIDLSVNPHYSGRVSNFFVNFPGFLIWAPAIWGYGYVAEIETVATIKKKDGTTQQVPIATKYYFREAEFDRTWTEISWFEVGAIALIGGIYDTQYDTDVTDEFITKVSPNYGAYVANKIVAAL